MSNRCEGGDRGYHGGVRECQTGVSVVTEDIIVVSGNVKQV